MGLDWIGHVISLPHIFLSKSVGETELDSNEEGSLRFSISNLLAFTVLVAVQMAVGIEIGLAVTFLAIFLCIFGMVICSFTCEAKEGRLLVEKNRVFAILELILIWSVINVIFGLPAIFMFPNWFLQHRYF